jgi:hypothetical protein
VVVGSDRCGIAVGQGGLELDSEGDLVGVHLCFSVGVVWTCRLRSLLRSRVTHEALTCEKHEADKACFDAAFLRLSERPTVPQHGATVALEHAPHCWADEPPKREGAPTVAPRFKMPNHGGLR